MDLLLHPARAEPYGMVIAEAMAAAVPVVISDRCGIAPDVSPERGEVLLPDGTLDNWVSACDGQLGRVAPPPRFVHDWQQVARQQVAIYRDWAAAGSGEGGVPPDA
jgi:UDP-glucose:(heptosyl)LPS alpha-1,3-glucosyltransferase